MSKQEIERLHDSLLHGKLPRDLQWSDAVELIEHLGKVEPHQGEEFAFVVGTQRAFFKHPHTHELGVEDVSRLRQLLKAAGPEKLRAVPGQPRRMIVVIDHHSAHIYHDLNGRVPQDEVTVKPYDPHGFHQHLIHRKEAHYAGERVPEEASFYEAVAKDLVGADEIVVIGHATGKSNAADHLLEYLKTRHSVLSKRVIGTDTADLSVLTEPEIEAIAKRHMIAVV